MLLRKKMEIHKQILNTHIHVEYKWTYNNYPAQRKKTLGVEGKTVNLFFS